MCRSIGYYVTWLHRVRIGNYWLPENLREGEYKLLSISDVSLLCFPNQFPINE